MVLPMTTTTVTIERRSEGADPYETAVWSVVAAGVPAVISGSSGAGSDVAGSQENIDAKLLLDEGVDVHQADRVTDEMSQQVWRCLWVRHRYELGLGHLAVGLTATSGATD